MGIWNRPAWSSVGGSATPEKKSHDTHERPQDSSPLSDPPPSSLIDSAADVGNGPGAQLHTSLSQSVGSPIVEIPAPTESFQSTESAGPPSSSASFPASQRILKEGKEVVISSDGEESDSSLEDPSVFLAPKSHSKKPGPSPKDIPNPVLSRPPPPKKYHNTIASIFQSAEADEKSRQKLKEVEEELSQLRGARDSIGGPKGFRESALTSAFGDGDDENGERCKAAVQRLEALDQDRTWHFFDPNQTPSVVLDFPRHLISPGSNIAALREPDSRTRLFESGILELASSMDKLPDGLIRWIFLSIPSEPRDELRAAYCRIFAAQTCPEKVGSLIRPDDIDDLFRALKARPEALDISEVIVADPPRLSQATRIPNRSILVSIFDLLRDSYQLFADDTFQRILHILLRMTLDRSLTGDVVVRSELQSCLACLLENISETKISLMEENIYTTLYHTIQDPQFQISVLVHILPTCPWIALLRYRLAAAFLRRSPAPLTDPVAKVLSLDRLTLLLARDKRFNVKLRESQGKFDYGDLRALTLLLDIVINTSLYDMGTAPKEFNKAIDRLARQVHDIFRSIQDIGASHVRRMLAKEALGVLHDRLKYAVRSVPPPKKSLFENYATEGNGNIQNHFKPKFRIDPNATSKDPPGDNPEDTQATDIPIRGHSQAS